MRVIGRPADKVFLEMREDLGGGKTRVVERVIELHPGAEAGAGEVER